MGVTMWRKDRQAKRAWLWGLRTRRGKSLDRAIEAGEIRKLEPATVAYLPPVLLPGEAKGRKKRRLALLKARTRALQQATTKEAPQGATAEESQQLP